jgi:hypothetical protein
MVFFGFPEGGRWNDLSCDGFAIGAGSVKFGDLGASLSELLVGMGENDAAIL